MATKAIYTKLNGKYYRLEQDTTNPTNIVRMPRTHSQMSTDEAAKVVNTCIWINTMDGSHLYSNRELYDEMIRYLTDNHVKEIKSIRNNFVMYCDYSIFNDKGEEVSHNTFTKKITPVDSIYNLGVDRNSELIYKQVKVFNTDIALMVRNDYPMGIMRNASKVRYSLHINDISIFQDTVYSECGEHTSTDRNSYPMTSVMDTMVRVYSTFENGLAIAAVEIPFIPKKIVLDLNITLDDMIVVYDNKDVMNVVNGNILGCFVADGKEDFDDEREENSGHNVQYILLNGGTSMQ